MAHTIPINPKSLTPTPGAGTMNTSPHWDTRRENLVSSKGVTTPHSIAAFLCLSSSAAIGRVIHYGGVIWAAFGAGRTFARFLTPFHATAHTVRSIGGGYYHSSKGIAA